LLTILLTVNVTALEVVPNPYEIDLGDGLIFYVTLPEDEIKGYPKSGLYKDEELLYSVEVDYGWWWSRPYFSNDAMTFLFEEGPRGSILFYEEGVITKKYKILDFLHNGEASLIPPRNDVPGDHTYKWDFGDLREYDRENNTLRILTAEDYLITFDLSTGLILSFEKELTGLSKSSWLFEDISQTESIISEDDIAADSEENTHSGIYPLIIVICLAGIALFAAGMLFRTKRKTR